VVWLPGLVCAERAREDRGDRGGAMGGGAAAVLRSRPALLRHHVGVQRPRVLAVPRSRLVELYDRHVSARHLDVGVANGWLLDVCRFPVAEPAITLMDLNPDALAIASARLGRYRPCTHQGSALEPFGLPANSFDSVGMSLLIHCLSGSVSSKAVVFEHARSVLAPGGVVSVPRC